MEGLVDILNSEQEDDFLFGKEIYYNMLAEHEYEECKIVLYGLLKKGWIRNPYQREGYIWKKFNHEHQIFCWKLI